MPPFDVFSFHGVLIRGECDFSLFHTVVTVYTYLSPTEYPLCVFVYLCVQCKIRIQLRSGRLSGVIGHSTRLLALLLFQQFPERPTPLFVVCHLLQQL